MNDYRMHVRPVASNCPDRRIGQIGQQSADSCPGPASSPTKSQSLPPTWIGIASRWGFNLEDAQVNVKRLGDRCAETREAGKGHA